MIIVDPIELGDAACTRASPKWVYDRTGTLVEVPANTLGVTYDPSDLSKAPYALVESASKNLMLWSEQFSAGTDWNRLNVVVDPNTMTAPNGELVADKIIASATSALHYVEQYPAMEAAKTHTRVWFFKAAEMWKVKLDIYSRPNVDPHVGVIFDARDGTFSSPVTRSGATQSYVAVSLPDGWWVVEQTFTLGGSDVQCFCRAALIDQVTNATTFLGDGVRGIFMWGAMLVEGERGGSYIRSDGSPAIRAADVISTTAGLIYSNVPMAEPSYNAATTYAKDAAVYDPVSKIVYWSMQAANLGKPLSDPAWWNKRTAINRWAMFDDRNSTVTSNPEEIIAVVSARAITQGVFAGALDASEVLVSMTHPTRGLVYSEARNLVLPRSGSSFFGWCFNRLRMRTWFLTLKLPVFANALVTITIRKPGGVAKCGMCLQGPVVDSGRSMIGLSSELKDYSSTTFYSDGTSDTIVRGYSKRMSVDVMVETDRVEELEDYLSGRRQKTLVYLASTTRGDTMLVGKFASLRKVIGNFHRSTMSLQIEGVLNR